MLNSVSNLNLYTPTKRRSQELFGTKKVLLKRQNQQKLGHGRQRVVHTHSILVKSKGDH